MRFGLLSAMLASFCCLSRCLAIEESEEAMVCSVAKLTTAPRIDAKWDKSPWKQIRPITIARHMGEKPSHFPRTQAKIAYDRDALYVIFRVEDRYVRAVTAENQGPVCTDSCVEFFFTPGSDVSDGYFNLEMNCGGTMLLYHQKAREQQAVMISAADLGRITVAHSLPQVVDPEIAKPVTWTVEYRVPLEMLKKYAPLTRPAAGVTWRANFYKCGDKTSHPHWLTWSPVGVPKPDFHRPEFFGVLKFE
jgi:hypothetical protein